METEEAPLYVTDFPYLRGLTESEMVKILDEVEAPKLAAILRAAGSTKPNKETHHR